MVASQDGYSTRNAPLTRLVAVRTFPAVSIKKAYFSINMSRCKFFLKVLPIYTRQRLLYLLIEHLPVPLQQLAVILS